MQTRESPINAMKQTISKMRESLVSGINVNLADLRTPTFDEEDQSMSSLNDTSIFGDQSDPTWTQYQREARKLLDDANKGRADDATHLVQTLQAALANYRSQNADLMSRIKELTVAADQHIAVQAQQERDKEQLAHELSLTRQELASLRAAKELNEHHDLDMQYKSGLNDSQGRESMQRQMISLIKDRDEALARVNALEEKLLARDGYGDIAKLHGEIRVLQEDLRVASARSVTEFDDERAKNQQTIADLVKQLKQANRTIEAVSTAEHTAQLHKQRGQEDPLLLQKLQHAQLENASLQKQLSTTGGARVRALEEALEEALNQRDGVIQKLRQVQGSQKSSGDSVTLVKQLQQVSVRLAVLERENERLRNENLLEREKSYRALHDHRLQRETLERSLREGEAQMNATIHKLQAAIRDKDAQIKDLQARNPYRDERQMQSYMLSKQRELSLSRSSQVALQNLAQRIAHQPSPQVNALRHEAELALHNANAVGADLPEGWEARTSDKGLVYYIDHQRKLSTWIHPKFGADTITFDDSELLTVPDYSATQYSVFQPQNYASATANSTLSSTTPMNTTPTGGFMAPSAVHQKMIANIQTVQQVQKAV